jgi:hypothetical protein
MLSMIPWSSGLVKKCPEYRATTGRHMMGQQVLTLGLSCEEGFVPLDSDYLLAKRKP